uniref:hypothetical protein n=1 Tax=Cephaloticoccus sp. TaxID=1985742 RepID=UPI00404B680A
HHKLSNEHLHSACSLNSRQVLKEVRCSLRDCLPIGLKTLGAGNSLDTQLLRHVDGTLPFLP